MNPAKRKQRIKSIVLLALIAAAALFMIYGNGSGKSGSYAVVTVDGAVCAVLPLSKDASYLAEDGRGGSNRIVVKDGAVYVSEADCANQVCVHTGAISQNGQVIACIPHGLVIAVKDDGEVDAVAY